MKIGSVCTSFIVTSCAIYLHTLVHIYALVGMGKRHTGGIELRHCDVSPGEVVWERIPERPHRYISYVACSVGYVIT